MWGVQDILLIHFTLYIHGKKLKRLLYAIIYLARSQCERQISVQADSKLLEVQMRHLFVSWLVYLQSNEKLNLLLKVRWRTSRISSVCHTRPSRKPLKVVRRSSCQTCVLASNLRYTWSPFCSCTNTAFPALSAMSAEVAWSWVLDRNSLFLRRCRVDRCAPPAWLKKTK